MHRFGKATLVRFACLLGLIFWVHAAAAREPVLTVSVAGSLDRVFLDTRIDDSRTGTDRARMALARNEFESIQLVLRSDEDIDGLDISATPLHRTGKPGTIDAEHVEIRVIGYVELVQPKISGSRTGFYPDPLLPNHPIALQKHIPQPVLVTVYAPRDTPPGDYQGSIEIKKSNAPVARVLLNIQVRDILLPDVSRFKTAAFAHRRIATLPWPDEKGDASPSQEEKDRRYMKAAELGFRNRLPLVAFMANGLNSYNFKGVCHTSYGYPTHDRPAGAGAIFNAGRTDALIDFLISRGSNHFFIAFTSDIYACEDTAEAREAELLSYLRDVVPHLRRRGLLDMAYVYNIDEPWGEAVTHAKRIYSLIKREIGSDVRIMQNTNQNNGRILEDLIGHFDAIDINLGFYDITRADRHRRRHPGQLDDFWWNINVWPDTRPNFLIEYPLIDSRVIGLLSYRYGISGFEYWELFALKGISGYSPVKRDEIRLGWKITKGSLDGTLVYPSEDHDYYSSLRFESFRDGMEDQELLFILEDLDPEHPLLNLPIVRTIEDYAQEPEAYLDFRAQVTDAIVALKSDPDRSPRQEASTSGPDRK